MNAIGYNRSSGIGGFAGAIGRLEDLTFRAELLDHAQREAVQRWTNRAMADAYLQVYKDRTRACREIERGVSLV